MPHQCTGCGHTFADGSKEMLSGCPECGGNKFQFRPEGASLPDDPGENDPRAAQPAPDRPDTSADNERPSGEAEPPEQEGTSSSVAETVGRATTKVRDFVSSDPAEIDAPDPNASWPSEREEAADSNASGGDSSADPSSSSGTDGDIIDADARREAVESNEDDAQASARTDVVSEEELDGADADAAGGSDALAGNGAGGLAGAGGEVVSEPTDEEPDIAELREQLNDQFESIKIVEPGQYELNLMELYDREEYIIALQENGRYVIQVPEQWIGDEPGDN